jgi:hypothetical protein
VATKSRPKATTHQNTEIPAKEIGISHATRTEAMPLILAAGSSAAASDVNEQPRHDGKCREHDQHEAGPDYRLVLNLPKSPHPEPFENVQNAPVWYGRWIGSHAPILTDGAATEMKGRHWSAKPTHSPQVN